MFSFFSKKSEDILEEKVEVSDKFDKIVSDLEEGLSYMRKGENVPEEIDDKIRYDLAMFIYDRDLQMTGNPVKDRIIGKKRKEIDLLFREYFKPPEGYDE